VILAKHLYTEEQHIILVLCSRDLIKQILEILTFGIMYVRVLKMRC